MKKKQIRIGTSGYSYKDWVGPVYPEGTKPSDYFDYYSTLFSLTELNFSYYKQPEPKTIERITAKAPDGFLFTIKGHKALTHEVDHSWEKQADLFIRGMEPMREHQKLAGVLLQFPYSFHYEDKNRMYLGELTSKFKELPLFLEFRNAEWQNESVYSEMKDQKIGYVVTDMPELHNLPSAAIEVTSSVGYFRLHGRNKENWWNGTNTSRYDYLYSRDELQNIVEKIWAMASDTQLLIITFNNHYKGKAVKNGKTLRDMLLLEKKEAYVIK